MVLRIIILFLFVSPSWIWAKGDGEIPLQFVFFQIFNFSLFTVALVYLVRKKMPDFLKQKQQDFLEYRRKATEEEAQQKKGCLLLEKEVQALVEKEKNLNLSVAKALDNLKKELEVQEKQWLESLKGQTDREIKLCRFKEFNDLRDRILFQVIQQTKDQLSKTKAKPIILDQMVQKWGNR